MHISEGFLPLTHAAAWSVAALPFLRMALPHLQNDTGNRYMLVASAGYLFTLTALKLPSVAGSSSHPTGVALGTVLVGPAVMAALSLIVLLFQALLTAHGGLTTLGANMISLGVVGPWVTWALWRLGRAWGERTALIVATICGSLATYACTAWQLAMAHPDERGGVSTAFVKFSAVFSMTQVPVAITEAVFTVIVLQVLATSAGPRQETPRVWEKH